MRILILSIILFLTLKKAEESVENVLDGNYIQSNIQKLQDLNQQIEQYKLKQGKINQFLKRIFKKNHKINEVFSIIEK
jgi:hypothetical protein